MQTSRSWILMGSLVLALAPAGCKKKPSDKKDAPAPAIMDSMASAGPNAPRTLGTAARPAARPRVATRPARLAPRSGAPLAGPSGGLSDPEVIDRAVKEASKPQLGAKGFSSGTATLATLCQQFVSKLVTCKLMPPRVASTQAQMCARAAAQKPAFRKRLGFMPRLPCGTLSRIVQPPVRRGVTVKDGQGVGIVTPKMLNDLGKDMILQATVQYGRDEAGTKLVQSICDKVYGVERSLGRSDVKPVCVAVKNPAFNAASLGGHIMFHTAAINALANLAIAQIAYAKNLSQYLGYQIKLAAHVLTRKPLAQWPVPGCTKGDLACRAAKLKDAKVAARFEGLLVAILGHEFGHLINNHARRKLVRAEVLRVNAAQFHKLSRGKKLAFMNKLGSIALSQADEYEADEASLRFLQAFWKKTSAHYKQITGDGLMGPHPMDIVYVALFMQALSDAIKLLTNKAQVPALLRSHPASHARADRAMRVIMANGYAGHQLAQAAYRMLILGKGG